MDSHTIFLTKRAVGMAALMEQMVRALYEHRGPTELQPAHWSALRFFKRAGPSARTVTGLAKSQHIHKGTASRTINVLVKRNLIRGFPHPDDGRTQIFELTKLGLETCAEDPLTKLATQISCLPEGQSSELAQILTQLCTGLGMYPTEDTDQDAEIVD